MERQQRLLRDREQGLEEVNQQREDEVRRNIQAEQELRNHWANDVEQRRQAEQQYVDQNYRLQTELDHLRARAQTMPNVPVGNLRADCQPGSGVAAAFAHPSQQLDRELQLALAAAAEQTLLRVRGPVSAPVQRSSAPAVAQYIPAVLPSRPPSLAHSNHSIPVHELVREAVLANAVGVLGNEDRGRKHER